MEEKNLNILKSEIYTSVGDYNKIKDEFEQNKVKMALYKNTIEIFKTHSIYDYINYMDLILVSFQNIYQNNNKSTDFISIVNNLKTYYEHTDFFEREIKENEDKLNDFIKKFQNERHLLSDKIQEQFSYIQDNTNMIIEYKRILSSFKYDILITPKQLRILESFMIEKNYSSIEQIKINERILEHNKKVKLDDYKPNHNSVLTIIEIKFDLKDITYIPKEKRKEYLDNQVDSIYNSISSDSLKNIENIIPNIESNLYSSNEWEYMVLSITNRFTQDYIDNQQLLIDKNMYNDKECKYQIISECKKIHNIINRLNYIYNTRKAQYQKSLKVEQKEEMANEIVNELLFAHPTNSDITYIEKDIDSIPKEMLETVKELLLDFQAGNEKKGKNKGFNTSNKKTADLRELRDDQIRITYKNVKDVGYVVVGLYQKKNDMDSIDREFYMKCAKRNTSIDNIEENKKNLQKIIKYIDENKRKGSR